MGRTAAGVFGMRFRDDDELVSMTVIPKELMDRVQNGEEVSDRLVAVTEHGYGKRTAIDEFPAYSRGSQGVIAMQCSERNGNLVTALQLFDGDQMMLISDKGTLVRTRTDEVSVLSRNTQGVRLIRLAQEDERLVGVERIAESDDEEEVEGEETEE